MKITKAGLLALLKGRGYDGDGSLASVKAYIEGDDGFDLVDATGKEISLDKLYRKTVTITADAGEDVVINDGSAADGDIEGAAMDGEDDEEDEVAKAYSRGLTKGRREKSAAVINGGIGSRTTRIQGASGTYKGMVTGYDSRVARKHLLPQNRQPVFNDGEKALAAGAFLRQKYREQAGPEAYRVGPADNDLEIIGDYFGLGRKASSTMDITGGAGFVPEILSADIIENLEEHGVARANAQSVTMSSDVQSFPVATADGSWVVVGEGATIAQSNPTNTQVKLTAAKWGDLALVSSELVNDSVIGWADYIGRSFGRSLASSEDTSLFIGNGLTAHRFIQGVTTKLQDVDGAGTDSAGLVSNSGINLFSEFTLAHFDSVCGTLPQYAAANAKWYTSRAFFYKVMLPLETGGNTMLGDVERAPGRMFRGDPVEFVQVMPGTVADTTVFAIYGDLSRGAMLGTVAGTMQIDFSNQRYFDSDQLCFRALQRTAITVHDVGSATVAGPLVGIQTAT